MGSSKQSPCDVCGDVCVCVGGGCYWITLSKNTWLICKHEAKKHPRLAYALTSVMRAGHPEGKRGRKR